MRCKASMWRGSIRSIGTPVLCSMALSGGMAAAGTIHVPGDHPTIQGAIVAAEPGDEIAVAEGMYFETIDFLGKAIRVYAEGSEYMTIIDASGWWSVVTFATGEGPGSILEGFTLEYGGGAIEGIWQYGGGVFIRDSSPTVRDCLLLFNYATFGAGIYIEGGAPTIEGCTLDTNEGGSGGGIYVAPGSAPLITRCNFWVNKAHNGGGIYSLESAPVIDRCEFLSNDGHGVSPTTGNGGGGLYSRDADVLVLDCTFYDNRSGSYNDGGAAYTDGGSLTVIGTQFLRNLAHAPIDDPVYGGALFNDDCRVRLINCSFGENEADPGDGGAIFNSAGSLEMINCTLYGNIAGGSGAGGGMCNGLDSTVRVANSILWNSSGGELVNLGTSVTEVAYSDIAGGYPGPGNLDTDPKLASPTTGNYTLRYVSPCIDAGVNNAVPADDFDLDGDGDRIERIPLDFFWNPRFVDKTTTIDTGCGEPVIVDMGFAEYEGNAVHPILYGDVGGDGIVDFDDLLDVLSNWGPCQDDCCLADVDFSGEVGFDDLLFVLSNWS